MDGAKEVVGSITSAVTNAAADMAVSKLVDNLNMQVPAEKLQRLEMLLIKIHCAIEAAEKVTHIIENTRLLQWCDKLKEAASAGDEVLASFSKRAMDTKTTSNADPQQQISASSSSSSTAAVNKGALSFTRSALLGIVQGIRSASKMFLSNEDLKVLSNTVKNLEQLSSDIGEFVRLLQLEVSSKAMENTEKTRIKKKSFKRVATRTCSRIATQVPSRSDYDTIIVVSETGEAAKNATVVKQEEQRGLLVRKLRNALAQISESVEEADSHDLKDHTWLASWANILREAKEQGYAFLEASYTGTTVINAKASKEFGQEKDELRIFMCTIETLGSVSTFCEVAMAEKAVSSMAFVVLKFVDTIKQAENHSRGGSVVHPSAAIYIYQGL